MSAKPAAEGAVVAEKPKSKKMLLIIVAVVVLALVGGGAAFFLMKKKPAEGEEGEEAVAEKTEKPEKPAVIRKAPDPKSPPTFMPLESMVVNLADPGGLRFAQFSITLKLEDSKTGDTVKLYMPAIRNGILLEVSQRTADELLGLEGKEKLARAILREVSGQLGFELDDEEEEEEEADTAKPTKKKRRAPAYTPVQAVLFSSFIIQ
jgi:flagellar protein FliL